MYEQAKISLKKYLGEKDKAPNVSMAIKVVAADFQEQEALLAYDSVQSTGGGFSNKMYRPMRSDYSSNWISDHQPKTVRGK